MTHSQPVTSIPGLISIVVPLYNEEGNVVTLARQVVEVMRQHQYHYELILVNDGSSDRTWPLIQSLSEENDCIVGIDLAGNHGQTLSLRAGFERAMGEVIIAMDGDLQHDPRYIPDFIRYINNGYEMVGGAKKKRPDGWLNTFLSRIAHRLICLLSGVNLSYFGATFKAYRSYLVKNVDLLGDSHRFLGAMVARKGIRYTEFPIEIRQRTFGRSNYRMNKVFKVLLDLIVLRFFLVYSQKPFRLFGFLGVLNSTIGLLVTGGMLVGSVFFRINIKEHYLAEFLFSLFLILSGIFLASFGILAEIGVNIYFSKKNHEPYIIRQVTDSSIDSHAETAYH